uniref:Uncharacterized protein n=1 Tax=Arundo donax TaxID=35708 RepID=A0A0A9GU26_ARUDO
MVPCVNIIYLEYERLHNLELVKHRSLCDP